MKLYKNIKIILTEKFEGVEKGTTGVIAIPSHVEYPEFAGVIFDDKVRYGHDLLYKGETYCTNERGYWIPIRYLKVFDSSRRIN
jgi:hypothetical protein